MFHNLALIPFRSVKKRLDITRSGIGLLDATGGDTVRIGATLSVPSGTPNGVYAASVPLTVAYE